MTKSLRQYLYLPNLSSIKQWLVFAYVLLGFLSKTFKDLAIKVQEKFEMSNCALLIDSMAIRKQIIYYTAQ